MRRLLIAAPALCLVALLTAQDARTPAKSIFVTSVDVTADSRISPNGIHVVSNEIRNQTYDVDTEIGERAGYLLQTQGYFKAIVGESQVRVLSESAHQKIVAVTLAIDEGEQYRLRDITFSNNRVFGAAQLREEFQIRDGDVFDTEKIRVGLERLRKVYASNGYINATPVPNTEADDSTQLLSLNIDMDEGGQFRFGPLALAGVEPRPGVAQELVTAWQTNIGKVCDPVIVEHFWREHLAPVLPSGSRFEHVVEESTYTEQHIVVLRISFP